jgi:hypothetical protein
VDRGSPYVECCKLKLPDGGGRWNDVEKFIYRDDQLEAECGVSVEESCRFFMDLTATRSRPGAM